MSNSPSFMLSKSASEMPDTATCRRHSKLRASSLLSPVLCADATVGRWTSCFWSTRQLETMATATATVFANA